MTISSTLYYGIINKELKVDYVLTYQQSGQFQTVRQRDNGNYIIRPSFGLAINEGYEKNKIFIPGNRYYHLLILLKKINKLVGDNLFEIFPNIGSNIEFAIDSKTLDRYQTEKALTIADMSVFPCVYANSTNECFPAIQINTQKGYVIIPFDDSIAIEKMLSTFEPNVYAISMLTMLK